MTQYKKYLEDNYTKGTIETYFKFKGIDITIPERKNERVKKDYSLILKTSLKQDMPILINGKKKEKKK